MSRNYTLYSFFLSCKYIQKSTLLLRNQNIKHINTHVARAFSIKAVLFNKLFRKSSYYESTRYKVFTIEFAESSTGPEIGSPKPSDMGCIPSNSTVTPRVLSIYEMKMFKGRL